jgi:cytochrome c peroxidase
MILLSFYFPRSWISNCFILLILVPILASPAVALSDPRNSLRQPVALAANETELLVANRNGTLTFVDKQTLAVTGERPVGERLSAIAISSTGQTAMVTDEQKQQLIVMSHTDGQWREAQRLKVPWSPVSLQFVGDDSVCSVACLWARQLAIVTNQKGPERSRGQQGFQDDNNWQLRHVVDLPFAPLRQLFDANAKRIVVADAFGGRLAVIDPYTGHILALRHLTGHNIRGLASTPDGKSLLVALQLVNEHVPTERDRIVWGAVVSNLVLTVAFDELMAGEPNATETRPITHWSLYPLGAAGHGSGDPADLRCDAAGRLFVALGGIDEVVQLRSARHERRCGVGRRPSYMFLDQRDDRMYVCNTLDDTISVINAASLELASMIELGDKLPRSQRDVGEALFYDARLSLDGWYSCHSCHPDGHSSGMRNDNLGDGDYGAPKRIPSILGVAQTAPLGWNGSKLDLAEQISSSLQFTMRATHPVADQQVAAIAAYLESLAPPPGIDRARGRVNRVAVERGKHVFQTRGCADCHAPPRYTTPAVYDVAVRDERERREFNPPSLLGASQRDSFFHDNRAVSLRDVFAIHRHPSGSEWKQEELDDLMAFLNAL